jgi:PKD repeat protein
MGATGDSITRAFNLCFFPFTDCPAQSWSTGTNSSVNSHARRLGITGTASNDARSGAKMSDLPGQATTVFNRNVGYVTVLMGGNDVCTDTEALMTSPSSYELNFRTAMDKLATDLTPPLVYVVSVPNVKNLWEILHGSSSARSAWNSYNVCQSLLANPQSTAQADVDRRERVKQRNMELNQRLRAACGTYTFCRFDGEASFGTAFVPNDVSTRDYFHPSSAGQAKLASVSYDNGYWGSKAVNGAPLAAFNAPTTCSLTCTFTDASSDPQGITGWSWNFDATRPGGPTSVVRNPAHTFPAAGTYTVTLHAIDALGATASVSRLITVEDAGGGADVTAPDAPTGLVATAGEGSVALDWNDSSEDDLAGYNVYRSAASGGTRTKLGSSTSSSFSDLTVTNGTTYYYVVTAVDTSANESLASGEESATPAGSGSGETPTVHVVDLDGSATAGKGQAWTATVTIHLQDQDSAPVSGALVSGSWNPGGSSSCTTNSAGSCTTSVSLNTKKAASTEFTVINVVVTGFEYDAGANTDADTDSNGTTIRFGL